MRQELQDIPALAKLSPQALAALEAAQARADVNNKKVDVSLMSRVQHGTHSRAHSSVAPIAGRMQH